MFTSKSSSILLIGFVVGIAVTTLFVHFKSSARGEIESTGLAQAGVLPQESQHIGMRTVALNLEAGVVNLKDPRQLAQIETAVAGFAATPLTQSLSARLSTDENSTSRLLVPLDGRVTRLVHQVGDTVRAGEPIIEIDAPDLGQAIADAAKSRADLALKVANLARAEDLFSNQVLARKELDAARAEQAESTAEFERTELRLKNLNAIGRTKGQIFALSSPIQGVIVERNATVGQQLIAASGAVIAIVTDPKKLSLLIDTPEADAEKMKVGMNIDFTVDDAPGERFKAKLLRIAPQLDPTTRRVEIRASVDNSLGRLRPEMFARALPTADEAQRATIIPASALLQVGSRTAVFIARKDGYFEQKTVEIALQTGSQVWLKSGVDVGQRVVVAGALLLKSELAAR